jgi:hypothetical protein
MNHSKNGQREPSRSHPPSGRILLVTPGGAAEPHLDRLGERITESSTLPVDICSSWRRLQQLLDPQSSVPIDLVFVRVHRFDLRPLSWVLRARHAFPHAEVVLLVDTLADATAKCLSSLGTRFVVPLAGSANLILDAVVPWVEVSRGRRAQERVDSLFAEAAVVPEPHGSPPPEGGLYQAEQGFREAYIRLVLTASASRREAASRARIPYRTFCQILRRLDIGRPSAGADASRSARSQRETMSQAGDLDPRRMVVQILPNE